MNNLLSCCGLVDVRINASDKDLPVQSDNYRQMRLCADAEEYYELDNKYPLCSLMIVLVLTSITDWQELSETLLFLCPGSIRKKNNQCK